MKITVVSDAQSWINVYLPELTEALEGSGHDVDWRHDPSDMGSGDLAFLLSVFQRLPARTLRRHAHNLVVHESELPRGRGWSPVTWQVLEGKHRIPVCLFEAVEEVDAGAVYAQDIIELNGGELVDEIRQNQAAATIRLCLRFVDEYPEILLKARPQEGEPTHYPRRVPADSELDPDRTLAEQFNLLRVVDNERYPAFFRFAGRSYTLKIERCRD